MKLENIELETDRLTGYDPVDDCNITIENSMSYLYTLTEIKKGGYVVGRRYEAVTWRTHLNCQYISNYLLSVEMDGGTDMFPERVLVRFGWIARNVNQLEFVPLRELLEKYKHGQLNSTEKSKFIAVCRQLNISMKQMSAIYHPKVERKSACKPKLAEVA